MTTLRSTFWRSSTVVVSALSRRRAEEALEALGEFQVGLLVDLSGVQGVESGLQAGLFGSQVGHAGP